MSVENHFPESSDVPERLEQCRILRKEIMEWVFDFSDLGWTGNREYEAACAELYEGSSFWRAPDEDRRAYLRAKRAQIKSAPITERHEEARGFHKVIQRELGRLARLEIRELFTKLSDSRGPHDMSRSGTGSRCGEGCTLECVLGEAVKREGCQTGLLEALRSVEYMERVFVRSPQSKASLMYYTCAHWVNSGRLCHVIDSLASLETEWRPRGESQYAISITSQKGSDAIRERWRKIFDDAEDSGLGEKKWMETYAALLS